MGLGLAPQVSSPEEIVRNAAWFLLRRESPVKQIVITEFSTAISDGTTVPFDDTVPTDTEGYQFASRAITPLHPSDILVIEAYVSFSADASRVCALSIFQSGNSAALKTAAVTVSSGDVFEEIYVRHKMLAGTISATTFTARCGPNAGTIYFNSRATGGRKYGGALTCWLMITEYGNL